MARRERVFLGGAFYKYIHLPNSAPSYETMLVPSHKDERQDCSICTHRVATHEENKHFLTTISLFQALGGGNDAKQRAGDRRKSELWGRKREGPPPRPRFFFFCLNDNL